MLGQNVRITTTVVPLQPGIKGQSILVRNLATARVTTAEVVDEGQLRTSF
jgi:flagella basal body P-ring formation protein FlgA